MAFDIALLKEHPYATGAVVIVGGIVVFYLINSGGSGTSAASSSNSNYSAALATDSQLAQAQAGVAVQTAAQQAQVQAAQINASVANNQTEAGVQTTDLSTYAQLIASLFSTQAQVQENATNVNASTTQLANQLLETQNTTQMQDNVLQDQIDQAANEQANNNATGLAGLVDQLNYQGSVNNLAYNLASQQQTNALNLDEQIIPLAGKQENSSLDATDQTSVLQTILAGGNPSVAASGTNASASAANSGNLQSASILNSISKLGATIGTGLFA